MTSRSTRSCIPGRTMWEAMEKILLVEDEPMMRDSIAFNLEREGLRVLQAEDGEVALELWRRHQPDVILLDLMLPKLSGLEVCRIIRHNSQTPILMLTARGEEMDRVAGLDLGADDYVTKPFSMRELMARVRALLRRSKAARFTVQGQPVLEFGELRIDRERHEVTVCGDEVQLSPKEYDLLETLALNPGRALTRQFLLERVWGTDFFGDETTLNVHIRWLRKKIEPDPEKPRWIQTVRGVGYKLKG